MSITYTLYIIGIALGFWVARWFYRDLSKVKDILFTPHSMIAALLYFMIIVGGLCSYMFFNVQVLGHDVSMSFPSATAMKERLGK